MFSCGQDNRKDRAIIFFAFWFLPFGSLKFFAVTLAYAKQVKLAKKAAKPFF
jgi:hypothetical protein